LSPLAISPILMIVALTAWFVRFMRLAVDFVHSGKKWVVGCCSGGRVWMDLDEAVSLTCSGGYVCVCAL
jgi:hypothetical protein